MELLEFEERYKDLYSIQVNGVPICDELRDGLNVAVNGGSAGEGSNMASKSGKISIRRIFDSFVKLKQLKKAKTLIFTSSVYRRDRGRNLAAEFLTDKYPEAVVFEWPSRNEGFDFAYFKDVLRDRYCPLEWYLIKYKIYMRLHRGEYNRNCDECRAMLDGIFPENTDGLPENHRRAIEYIKAEMPNSYAVTVISQNIFRKLFRKYWNIEYAVDFWGSARENIIPVLPGKPQSVELQHGIITRIHPGYIYPKFVKELDLDFFKRTLLVYGNKTKEMLTEDSVFDPDRVEVIGNPRIIKYKQEFKVNAEERNLILFTSQPFEQDGIADDYYSTVIGFLKDINEYLSSRGDIRIAVKLHPRESQDAITAYSTDLPNVKIFDSTSGLYELFSMTVLHITVTSTTLFEAALFQVPTVTLNIQTLYGTQSYGFKTLSISRDDYKEILSAILSDKVFFSNYTDYLGEMTKEYM